MPGAGGWGDPLERDPDATAAGIRKGRLSANYVREHYALVFAEDGELDEAGTERLRAPVESLEATNPSQSDRADRESLRCSK